MITLLIYLIINYATFKAELYIPLYIYKLFAQGHSLGGGVAVTMGVIIRHRYPTLKCFAFSPPGE